MKTALFKFAVILGTIATLIWMIHWFDPSAPKTHADMPNFWNHYRIATNGERYVVQFHGQTGKWVSIDNTETSQKELAEQDVRLFVSCDERNWIEDQKPQKDYSSWKAVEQK